MDFDVQNHARSRALRSPDHLRVGAFTVRYDPAWTSRYANYAIPDDGAATSTVELAALVEAFRGLGRVPRLEYLPACAPELEPALLAGGFAVENRAVVMACTAETLIVPQPRDGIRISEPAADADIDLARAAHVQHVGYGGTGEADEAQIAWMRSTVTGGGVLALAETVDGEAVGVGVCSAPMDGLSELAGLAVDAGHRRKGIAAAVAGYLTAATLARGCRTVWLEPGDSDIQRIYERIGYSVIGEKLNISLPEQ